MSERAGKNRRSATDESVLLVAVLVHFAVTCVHGFAHAQAKVAMSSGSMVFILSVIVVGPILGLLAQRIALPRAGAWAISAMMAAALAFGLINHFLFPGPDHITHVAEAWRSLFSVTAAALVLTEAFGATVAAVCATRAGKQQ
jgi:hypothetical protein